MDLTAKQTCPRCHGGQIVPSKWLPVYFRCWLCHGEGETSGLAATGWLQRQWNEQRAE